MDISTYIDKVAYKFAETEEDFIFQTVLPYCNRVTQREISKKELTEALLNYRELEKENERLRDKLYSIELALEALQEQIKYQ